MNDYDYDSGADYHHELWYNELQSMRHEGERALEETREEQGYLRGFERCTDDRFPEPLNFDEE